MSEGVLHKCDPDTAWHECGPAINYCEQTEDGFLLAGNSEYETMVNYCPFCGYKAPRQAIGQDEWEAILAEVEDEEA